ncbi:type II toxin-antitoxin system VapC family toxin [Brevundimonas sp. SL130]|uniref:type II toxin-antitoxin system VapC family toxin n=1 Tax=Brevundimonas sp. SL130 TaxID=2995143 RepID=UPI00226D1B91|nr:type II toxin-antitoxin system VapC family toxin [Brevundimonas sp. SL130]WAC58893.1 type II toxin-antitoxin system VapC family toxin [Brevundimonas sp. SL130]
MSFYFDASVLLALLLNEPAAESIDRFMRGHVQTISVSTLCTAECSAAISGLVRMRRRSEAEVTILLQRLDDWIDAFGARAAILDADIEDACLLVRRFDLKLRTPDAIHIAVARRLNAQLITLDHPMAQAATLLNLNCINPADTSAK